MSGAPIEWASRTSHLAIRRWRSRVKRMLLGQRPIRWPRVTPWRITRLVRRIHPRARRATSGPPSRGRATGCRGGSQCRPSGLGGPVALCEEEPDHLGGRVGPPRVGVGPDRAPPVPRVPAAMHRPGLSEDDAVDVGVHGAGAGWPLVRSSRRVESDTEASIVASRAATRFSAFTGGHDPVAVAVEHD